MKPSHRSAALAVTAAGCAVAFSLQGTQAAWTATTSSKAEFSAGTIAIGTDSNVAVPFSATGLTPGQSASKCIVVTYTGTIESQVRLYLTGLAQTDAVGDGPDLATNLMVKVEYATSPTTGAFVAGCGNFEDNKAATALFEGTLTQLNALGNTFAGGIALGSGAGTDFWQPAATGSRVFKITWTLPGTVGNTVQGDGAAADFTWEARST
jgi:hypothetical protein